MFSMLTIGFILFLVLVAASFVLTLMPVPINTEGGRADQRFVHQAAFVPDHGETTYPFVIADLCDDDELGGSQISSEQDFESDFDSDPLHQPSIFTSHSAPEPFKEAA